MSKLNEGLHAGDLKYLVRDVFEIDSYASKMGEDSDIVVLSFTVDEEAPARDLVNFIEHGYDFVLDADVTPGELDDGRYKVFVEIERNRKIGKQILEVLDGVKKLSEVENFKFRYYKSFHSTPATEDALTETIPINKNDYETRMKESRMNNFSNFFNRSYLESIDVDSDNITFHKKYAEPLRMKIRSFGPKNEMYNQTPGRIMLEGKDVAEVIFLTKFLGNYNITKVGGSFILENEGYAVVLEKK
jgi:hypothetical protein